MRYFFSAIVFLVFMFGCKSFIKTEEIQNISLVELIANPNKYHKKKIKVAGYFSNEHDGRAIYISKNDFITGIYKNGIYLYYGNLPMQKFEIEPPYQGYVTIIGVYNKDMKGSYNFYSGGFEEVISLKRMYLRGSLSDEYNME